MYILLIYDNLLHVSTLFGHPNPSVMIKIKVYRSSVANYFGVLDSIIHCEVKYIEILLNL